MSFSGLLQPVSDAPTILRLLERQAGRTPAATALSAPGREPLSYADLFEQVRALAAELSQRGLGRGDRIGLVLPNGPELAVAFLGVTAVATAVPLNPAYQAGEFEVALADMGVRAVLLPEGADSPARSVARERGLPILELTSGGEGPAGICQSTGGSVGPPRELDWVSAEDIAIVLQTSGTTARPKVVPLAQQNVYASVHHICTYRSLSPADRCLNLVPLFHIYGLISLLAALSVGGEFICAPRFDPVSVWGWLHEFHPTYYTAVPAMHQAILAAASSREGVSPPKLRFVPSSGAPLPTRVREQLELVFQAPVIESYGTSETSLIAMEPEAAQARKPGSVGLAAGPEVRIIDESGRPLPPGTTGEVVVRGPNVMAGYENNPSANALAFIDGWFRTGDLGYLDAEGYLFLTGRLKELINHGGEKIAPWEIDEVLLTHPSVGQAVSFALPDELLGETVAAGVVLRTDALATTRELQAHVARHLALHKVPRRIVFVTELPRTPSGKLRRIGLAEHLGLGQMRPAAERGQSAPVLPRTPIEERLAAIWGTVLEYTPVGVQDDFFDLGGTSVQAARLIREIEQALGKQLAISTLIEAGTVEELARLLSDPNPAVPQSPLVAIQPNGTRPPLFCVHPVGGSVYVFRPLAKHLGPDQPLFGLQSVASDESSLGPMEVEELADRYLQAIKTVQASGPYHLGGFSFGGTVAYEMARQLQAQGEQVALLALMDTWGPDSYEMFTVQSRTVRHLRSMRKLSHRQKLRYAWERAAAIHRKIRGLLGQGMFLWRFAARDRVPQDRLRLSMAHLQALRRYRPGAYPGRITLFRAAHRGIFADADPLMGWGSVALGGVEVREVPGAHDNLLSEQFVPLLAEGLRECLDQALLLRLRAVAGGDVPGAVHLDQADGAEPEAEFSKRAVVMPEPHVAAGREVEQRADER